MSQKLIAGFEQHVEITRSDITLTAEGWSVLKSRVDRMRIKCLKDATGSWLDLKQSADERLASLSVSQKGAEEPSEFEFELTVETAMALRDWLNVFIENDVVGTCPTEAT